jgi:hypothetical protein
MTTSDPEIMDIARCAEIAAHLAHFPPQNHAEIVARFGLRWRDWEAASARATAGRDAELAAGAAYLSSRFVHAFVTISERLQAQQPSLESIGPLPHTFRLEATPVAEVAPLPSGVESEPPAVEVTRVPAGTAEIEAPSFWIQGGSLTALPASRLLAATAAASDAPAMRLPFSPGSALGPAIDRASAPAAVAQGPRAPSPSAGATVAVSELAAAPRLPHGAPELTVEQYTSLRVELHLLPDHAATILARYGGRPEGKEALFAHWQSRFEADPPLRMLFARNYAQYLAWLRQTPGALESLTAASP